MTAQEPYLTPIFSGEEMARRRRLLADALEAAGAGAAFLHTADSVYYLTGVPLLSEWGRPMWAVLVPGGRLSLIGARIEAENMESCGAADEVLVFDDAENVTQAALELAASRLPRGGRLALERPLIPLGLLEGVEAACEPTEVLDVGSMLGPIRVIKSEEELELLRIAGQVSKLGASAFLEALAPGIPELTIAAHAVGEMDRGMAALFPRGGTRSYAYCQSGLHTLTPHLHPTGRRVRSGEVVGLNVFAVLAGYCVELERTVVLGSPSDPQSEALDAVEAAAAAALALFKPGVLMSEVDQAATEVLHQRGYDGYLRHGTGHAHGIMIGQASREELGELRSYNRAPLTVGMAASIEPGVYLPDLGGFRHSDVYLLTVGGPEWVTEFPYRLS